MTSPRFTPLVASVLACTALLSAPAVARAEDGTASNGHDGGSGGSDGTFLFQWDNDKVADTDRHYTNGMRLAYTYDAPTGQWGAAGRAMADYTLFPTPHAPRTGWVVGQDMFTPEDVDRYVPDPADRPYAGWSYVGFSVQSEHADRQDAMELDVGMIGPASKAAQAQNAFHRLINVSISRGWRSQIHNEPGLMATRTLKLRSAPFFSFGAYGLDAVGHGRAQLGNVRTGAAAGATLRFGRNLDQDFGPAYGGATLPQKRPERPTYSLFVGGEAHAVLWDVFLDGNTFRDSPDVNKKPAILEARTGFTVHWPLRSRWVKGLRTTLNLVHRTREFETQDKADRYGSLQVSLNF